MVFPDKKYKIVYADPPWTFEVWSKKGVTSRSPQAHYDVMSLDDIKLLPVRSIADDNCTLLMWTTRAHMKESFGVIESWGFDYKTIGFTWVKRNKNFVKNFTKYLSLYSLGCISLDDMLELILTKYFMGMGHWTRSNSEYCLLATIGNPVRVDRGVKELVVSPVEKHSKKPDEVRKRIVRLLGDVPKIELFAREKVKGWDSWGNEV